MVLSQMEEDMDRKNIHFPIKFLINFIFLAFVFTYALPALGSDILQEVDTIEDLKIDPYYAFDGKFFIFSQYDSTGNKKELVFYDLRQKKAVLTIPSLPIAIKYLYSDDKYILTDNGYQNGIIAFDREKQRKLKEIDVGDGVKDAFIIEERLYVTRSIGQWEGLGLIYDLKTFKLLSSNIIDNPYVSLFTDNKLIVLGYNIYSLNITIYDKDFNLIRQDKGKFNCSVSGGGKFNNKILFSDSCGKIYQYDLIDGEIEHVYDIENLGIPKGLHSYASIKFDFNDDGLMLTIPYEHGSPKIFDLKSKKSLRTLNLKGIPNGGFFDKDRIYFIYYKYMGKSRIEAYTYKKELFYSTQSYIDDLKREHEKAIKVFKEERDIYKAIELLENADIQLLIKDKHQIDIDAKITILNDYAYFLSMTYERFKEAIPLFEQVILLSPERPYPYINISDTYFKWHTYENASAEILQKAKEYYEIYRKLMNKKGLSKNTLMRTFEKHEKELSIEKLNIDVKGSISDKLFLYGDKIFVSKSHCYVDKKLGQFVYIYDREKHSLIKELRVIYGCDDEMQDGISSIAVADNKLFVATHYRYEDNERPNLFVYDISEFQLLGKYALGKVGINKLAVITNKLLISQAEFWNKIKTYELYDIKTLEKVEQKDFLNIDYANESDIKYLEEFITGNKNIANLKGGYETNNKKYLITKYKKHNEKPFLNIYNLFTFERKEKIELPQERPNFYLFDDLDKVAIRFFSDHMSQIQLYDIKNNKMQTILSLENDPGRLVIRSPIFQTYKHYLIIAHRRSLIFYDVKKMTIVRVIKDIVPEDFTKKKEADDRNRIDNLVVDKDKRRLLVITFDGLNNRVLNLGFLQN